MINNNSLLDNYIDSMIENTNINNFPNEINLILDGGAFNGAYTAGCVYYIKKLEKNNISKINYISGCSIGAILGFLFLTDKLHYAPTIYSTLLNKTRNDIIINTLPEVINYFVSDTDIDKVNNRLFISYYDIETLKHNVQSKFANREELVDILIRSSYVPYFIDGQLKYKNKYCDGFLPHIFNKSNIKTIFISLINIFNIKESVYTKNDKNIWNKLFKGLDDINLFFNNSKYKHSLYCSYLDKWNVINFILFKFRELLTLCFIIILKYNKVIANLPDIIVNNIIYIRIKEIIVSLIKNILSYNIL
jgi:hypothetical protein